MSVLEASEFMRLPMGTIRRWMKNGIVDIGETVKSEDGSKTVFLIFSEKVARYAGVPEEEIISTLKERDLAKGKHYGQYSKQT